MCFETEILFIAFLKYIYGSNKMSSLVDQTKMTKVWIIFTLDWSRWTSKIMFNSGGDEKFGVKGGYPLKKNKGLAHLITAYGEFCYFYFPSFSSFFSPIFLPPLEF